MQTETMRPAPATNGASEPTEVRESENLGDYAIVVGVVPYKIASEMADVAFKGLNHRCPPGWVSPDDWHARVKMAMEAVMELPFLPDDVRPRFAKIKEDPQGGGAYLSGISLS